MSNNPQITSSKLIILSAPSGTGKSTLCSMLLAKHPQFRISISHTTRTPRGDEKDGSHYYFVTEDAFEKLISQNAFLEYAHVFKRYWYGTSRKQVDENLSQGFNVLFDIDVQGACSLKKIYADRCITIFVLPPSLEELEKRLRSRATESEASIQNRLETAKNELRQSKKFDYQILNNDLPTALLALENILKKENCI